MTITYFKTRIIPNQTNDYTLHSQNEVAFTSFKSGPEKVKLDSSFVFSLPFWLWVKCWSNNYAYSTLTDKK